MRIAVVGSGVAGLVCAHRLAAEHDVTLFEACASPGGHVHTVDVPGDRAGETIAVDMGFIVFNDRTYPGFVALLEELGVDWRESDMSFSVRCARRGLEYNGTSLNALFAQRRNALRPSFWRMVRDILRFYREAPKALDDPSFPTLGEWLARERYSPAFVRDHLLPMSAAVWSAPPEDMLAFPARTLVRFFANHGFLQVDDRPRWRTVRGGSREWVRALLARFPGRLRLNTPVRSVRRTDAGVQLALDDDAPHFERVVLGTHGDQALALLTDATALEREVLGSFRTQPNLAQLHQDARLLPRRPLARASWNYHLLTTPSPRATVSYWMNALQGFTSAEPWIVSLNMQEHVDPRRVARAIEFRHPLFDEAAVRAQARHAELNGSHLVYFAGAYWGYGFHEDGLRSADATCAHLRRELIHAA